MTEEPGYRPEQLIRPVPRPLVAAGIAGFTGALMIAALWATEPGSLPARTRWGFAGLILIGLCWAALAAWTLWRRPLFAVDRVVAGWLAVVFTSVTTLFTAILATPWAAVPGLLTTAAAIVVLVRARAHRDQLRSHLAALEE
ncbi:hypothetical protein Aph02nite_30370 [Actinoplanes philippinensis]|uniref:Uncharacterized protein n=1 Tax=Actinoplanes philippinensis TaxID=35752 RepID=A0A1I2ED81_9ACTN|nr:hypothetical protein [Actinoplanes philippinensis]GIE77087.1 hypothetical protein Aph02nite_30370 [Actinoplanes philippinensis]SFE90679.1 hypothetical protein SAMN05421541_104369 [Actinoplanes philippinensis]